MFASTSSTPAWERQPETLLPFVRFGLVFAVYPLSQVVRMAGSDVQIRSGSFEWRWTGMENLRSVLTDPASWQALGNTVVFVVATVALSLLLGLALALLMDRSVTLLPLARRSGDLKSHEK